MAQLFPWTPPALRVTIIYITRVTLTRFSVPLLPNTQLREKLMVAARRREIDVVLVWRLDRWGRSLADLVVTLKELAELSVGFVSLTEALDLTTPTGRAMAGLLSVFAELEHEILRERIRAGIVEAPNDAFLPVYEQRLIRSPLDVSIARS
jgi:Resolvase, N terminal domain